MSICRAFQGLARACLLFSLLLSLQACGGKEAMVLSITAPEGTLLRSYVVEVQDRGSRKLIYSSGITRFDKPRDVFSSPIRVGLQFDQNGVFLIHVRAARIAELETLPRDAKDGSSEPEYFFATMHQTFTVPQIDALLLPVEPAYDKDRDHFPDIDRWLASDPKVAELYAAQPEVLDCLDAQPGPGDLFPLSLGASDVHPFAQPLCNVRLRPPAANPAAPPQPFLDLDVSCGGQPRSCADADGDGDPEQTDCDDFDPRRFHGNPKLRNCCQCTRVEECEANHEKIADLSLCEPARCGVSFDFDCTGQSVDCFVDDDCDGYAANDPDPKKRDCDDKDTRVHPNAKVICDPPAEDANKDWACDGNPKKGCVPCDLDGDGFQRSGQEVYSDTKCPSEEYKKNGKPIDCDDADRGVFPGSSTTDGNAPFARDLSKTAMGGTVAGAMRGLCRNKNFAGTGPQDTNCDGKPRTGCPLELTGDATCDQDGDGFPSAACKGKFPDLLAAYKADCADTVAEARGDAPEQIFPGAPVKCPTVQGDRNCDNLPDVCRADQDNDGYDVLNDCNDTAADSRPFALELCDGRDNDCDGLIDEGNPDVRGVPMVETLPNGQKALLSCNDSKVGLCGSTKRLDAARYTGRCVCTAFVPNSINRSQQTVITGGRDACPGEPAPLPEPKDSDRSAPRCFDAYQPLPQTCNADQPEDNDCDGRTDDPEGKNLVEAQRQLTCGRTVGECRAGKVVGCDRRTPSPFSSAGTPSRSVPGYNERERFYVCDSTTIAPKNEACNGKDDDCNGSLPGPAAGLARDESDSDGDTYLGCSNCSLADLKKDPVTNQPLFKGCDDCNDNPAQGGRSVYPGAPELCDLVDNACKGLNYTPATDDGKDDCTNPASAKCCVGRCADLQKDAANCGACGKTCNVNISPQCAAGVCTCDGQPACAGGSVCFPGSGCVECRDQNDCKNKGERKQCDNSHVCTQCTTDMDCPTPAAPACRTVKDKPEQNSCVACTDSMAHCQGLGRDPNRTQCNKATSTCVECIDNGASDLCKAKYPGVTGKPYCVNNTCVQCENGDQCKDRRIGDECSAAGACTCKGAPSCNATTLFCGAPTLACVPCADPAKDCTVLSDICSATGTCSCGNRGTPCDAKFADNCTGGKCQCDNKVCDTVRSDQCKDKKCLCGAKDACDTNLASTCTAGKCLCGTKDACNKDVSSTCVAATSTCLCGMNPACDPKLSSSCDGTKCLCGMIDACDPRTSSSCDKDNNKCLCGMADACDPTSAKPLCNAAAGKCVKCVKNADCDPMSSTPICDNNGSCVQCSANADCKSNLGQGCDTMANKCKCTANTDCPSNSCNMGVCDD